MCCVMLDAQQTCLVVFSPSFAAGESVEETSRFKWSRTAILAQSSTWTAHRSERRSDKMSEVPSTKLGKRA